MIDLVPLALLIGIGLVFVLIRRNLIRRKRNQNKVGIIQEPSHDVMRFQLDHNRKLELSPASIGTSPFCILIVDDQPSIRLLMRELFEIENITVYEAPNGKTAIEQVHYHRFDFILLDLKMPDTDGIQALREIRKIDREVRVAMISAYGDPDKLEEAREMGVQAFFTKPFDIKQVKNHVMSSLLAKKEREEGVS